MNKRIDTVALAILTLSLCIVAFIGSAGADSPGEGGHYEIVMTQSKERLAAIKAAGLGIHYIQFEQGIPVNDATESLLRNRADVIRFYIPQHEPCNDARECTDAVDDSCEAIDEDTSAVTFSQGEDCSGTCSNGSSVRVECD